MKKEDLIKIIYDSFQTRKISTETEVLFTSIKHCKGVFEYGLTKEQKPEFKQLCEYIKKHQQTTEIELINFVIDFFSVTSNISKQM